MIKMMSGPVPDTERSHVTFALMNGLDGAGVRVGTGCFR